MIFRVLIVLLFIAIIVGSFWFGGEQKETTTATTVEATDEEDLGYSAKNATLTETGTDGLPVYTLNADVIRQHPGDHVEFEQVHMTFRDDKGQTWKGRANRGDLVTETGKVDLTGDVHVDGLLPGSDQMADLATEKMSVDTHEEIISTAEPVVVNSTGRQLKSKGMVATLKENHLLLESNVRGMFTP